jgi:hypothetical protein
MYLSRTFESFKILRRVTTILLLHRPLLVALFDR